MSYFLIIPGEDGASVHVINHELNMTAEWWEENYGINLAHALDEQDVKQYGNPNYWGWEMKQEGRIKSLQYDRPFLLIKGTAIRPYPEEVTTRWRF